MSESSGHERDRSADAVTADQQANNKSDVEITRRIRQDLIADKDLSTYAHNVKIITVAGSVTLKGPVRSGKEESEVLKCAKAIAGETKVTNQMQVARAK